MKKTAEVLSVDGNLARIKVKRSDMCEGCSAREGDCSCSHASLLGADKTLVTTARNDALASVGDKVEVETSDSRVLGYAVLVFILPLIVCALTYGVILKCFNNGAVSLISAVIAFILTFVVIGVYERHHRKSVDVVITRIIVQGDGTDLNS